MRTSSLLVAFGICAGATAASEQSPTATAADAQPTDVLALLSSLNEQAIDMLGANEAKRSTRTCSIFNARVRKDWDHLCAKDRKAYIDAVKCLQKLPSKSNPTWAPGARTRYDDFVAIHIDLTPKIHGTGNFLTWHRYFTWAYENALQTECGYTGAQPYWNWFANADDLTNSPVFDGSETSMSGDGAYFEHNGSVGGGGKIKLPSGNGGGCVESGPFKDMVVNVGPVRPGMDGMTANPNGSLGYNPRCLRRDLTGYTAGKWFTANNLLNITIGRASGSIAAFQNELQGRFDDGFLGMHAAGHFSVGGEASDLYSSPADPSFFLHHAMVDRIYWIWQALHPFKANDIAGGNHMLAPTGPALKTDPLELGPVGSTITLKDALSTLGGPFCYIYL